MTPGFNDYVAVRGRCPASCIVSEVVVPPVRSLLSLSYIYGCTVSGNDPPGESVVSPFPQGRNENLDRIDAVKQILPETAVLYSGMEVGIGCADQPDIDRSLFGRSQAVYLLLFDYRKQFGLEHKRQVSDLVQKERATGCDLETSRLTFICIRKAPFS